MVDNIELEHHFSAVVENAADAAKVFIAHHHCRKHFVNVKCLVVESTDLSKLTTSIINSQERAILFEKRIHLLTNLTIGKSWRRVGSWRRRW